MNIFKINIIGILFFLQIFFPFNGFAEIVEQKNLQIATFDIDATPPIGTYLAYDSVINKWDLGLRARGIILLGSGKPIVLCAVDWIGIGNEGHDAFCATLAQAAGTTSDRVAVHAVHQHDTPWCDFGAEEILKEAGFNPTKYDGTFSRNLLKELGNAIKISLENPIYVSDIGYGQSEVYNVASNRRIIGADGHIRAQRLSWCPDSCIRAEPVGLIDPMISVISFWNEGQSIAVLSYYAVHPQSYYRTGITNPDFPGIARFYRQLELPQTLHIHFNGAGGNLATSKYNDSTKKENRVILAQRLADGMKRAWEATKIFPVTANQVSWNVVDVALPPAKYLYTLQEKNWSKDSLLIKCYPARLAWLHRCQAGLKINISCLSLGKIRILHLPGEPFVEYQLAAKAERTDLFVAVAGYGDYGPGYIGTADAYQQGGYEVSHVSNVAPEAASVLMNAIRKLLHDD